MATNGALGFRQPSEPLKDFQTISTIADIHDPLAVNKDLRVKDYASARRLGERPCPNRCASPARASATSRIYEVSCSARATSSGWRSWGYKGSAERCAT